MSTIYIEGLHATVYNRFVIVYYHFYPHSQVWEGHECAPLFQSFFCDHIIEQVPPTANWGTTFLVAPIRTQANTFGNDILKLVSSRIHTSVNISCITSPMGESMRSIPVSLRLNGDSFNLTIFNEFCSIEADKPILVVQISSNRGQPWGAAIQQGSHIPH